MFSNRQSRTVGGGKMIVVSDEKLTILDSSKNEIIRTIVELIKVLLEVGE